MKKTILELVDIWMNALQLCFKTPISGYSLEPEDVLLINFESVPQKDRGFEYFLKLFGKDADWDKSTLVLKVKNFSKMSGPAYNFLMLSRLRDENMKALAKLDTQYRPFVQTILGEYAEAVEEKVETLRQASQIAFSRVEEQKMTLRELAHRSGLTQVALSNFKSGKDIRLSNFLKILKALKLHLTIDRSA